VQANVHGKAAPDHVYVKIVSKKGEYPYPFTTFTKEDDEYTFPITQDLYYHRYGEYDVYVCVKDDWLEKEHVTKIDGIVHFKVGQ